jgi:mannose/cellobiose epimerase-like protein (N-acyl-D-glucosamine 2-epimerase family)
MTLQEDADELVANAIRAGASLGGIARVKDEAFMSRMTSPPGAGFVWARLLVSLAMALDDADDTPDERVNAVLIALNAAIETKLGLGSGVYKSLADAKAAMIRAAAK